MFHHNNEEMMVGRYKLLEFIGGGTCGEVWRALAPGDIAVAMKIVPWSLSGIEARRELRALELLKDLHHVFLIQIHAYLVQHKRLYIVMELADRSLRALDTACRRDGKSGIGVTNLLRYCREVAEAVDYLNGKSVVHRDVKPDNILLVGTHAKLGDCGMARLQEQEWQRKASIAGTASYMAPEAFHGKPNGNSDQYALGMTYLELRLGRLPFSCTSLPEWMQAHLHTYPDLAPLQGEEQQVLLKALAKDHTQRHASCVEFVRALVQAQPKEIELAADPGNGSEI